MRNSKTTPFLFQSNLGASASRKAWFELFYYALDARIGWRLGVEAGPAAAARLFAASCAEHRHRLFGTEGVS